MAYLFDDALDESLKVDQAPTSGYPLSMACWFNTDTSGVTQGLVFTGDKDIDNHWHVLFCGNTTVSAITRSDAVTSGRANATAVFSTNVWHHGAGVWTSATNRAVFYDGGNKGTNATNVSISGEDRVAIGNFLDLNPSSPFSGLLAEVAMWDAALSDAEVAILAAGYSPLFVRPQNLVFYAPIVRDLLDRVGGLTLSLVGAPSVAPQPPIIYPSSTPHAFISGLPPVPEFRRRRYMIGPM